MIKVFIMAFVVPNGIPVVSSSVDDTVYNSSLRVVQQVFDRQDVCLSELAKAEKYLKSVNANYIIVEKCEG